MTGWRRLALLLGLAGCMVTGCGIQPTGVIGGSPAVSVPGREGGVELCLLDSDRLHAVERFDVVLDGGGVPAGQDWEKGWGISSWPDLTKIGNLLALGPTPAEQEAGLTSEVPASLRLGLAYLVYEGFAPWDGVGVPEVTDEDGAGRNGTQATPTPEGESTTVGIVVEEPNPSDSGSADHLPVLAAQQVACTVELYLDRLEDDRDVILVDMFGQPYKDTLGVTGQVDR